MDFFFAHGIKISTTAFALERQLLDDREGKRDQRMCASRLRVDDDWEEENVLLFFCSSQSDIPQMVLAEGVWRVLTHCGHVSVHPSTSPHEWVFFQAFQCVH